MPAASLFNERPDRDDATPTSSPAAAPPNAYAQTSSLYRKHRPASFGAEELVGQEHIVRTLQNAIALDRVAHAYLFCGPRGTGKTTTARLLAKAVNCLDPDPARRPCNRCANCEAINAGSSPDIIEIDAASNRGIDDIRDLRERIRYAPTQLSSKVYIIDEAHQITGAAANAFLKTLEEPPAHSRFILATTDPEELLPTIVSRCQRYEFRRIGAEDMTRRIRTVADREAIAIADDALKLVARHATGSLRDALGLLEQLALLASPSEGQAREITAEDVSSALGLSRNDRIESLVGALARRATGDALRVVQDAIDEGEDPRQLNRQLISYVRLLLLERSGGVSGADAVARELAGQFTLRDLASVAQRFSDIDFTIKHSPFPQLPLEIAIVELTAEAPGAVAAGATPPPAMAPAAQDAPPPPSRVTSLRERVRNPAATRESAPQRQETAPRQSVEPVSISAPRPVPVAPPAAKPPAGSPAGGPTVEQIAELWPNVRGDVKALNRRVEALLSEVDPVAISGNQITLAVPYPFHRDKLNSDEVREIIASVLSRLLARDVSVICILRGEMPPASNGAVPPPVVTPSIAAPPPAPAAPVQADEDAEMARLRAARNIFDAEEIDEAEFNRIVGDVNKS